MKSAVQNIKNRSFTLLNYITGTKKKKFCFIAVSIVTVSVVIVNLTIFLWPTLDNTGISNKQYENY